MSKDRTKLIKIIIILAALGVALIHLYFCVKKSIWYISPINAFLFSGIALGAWLTDNDILIGGKGTSVQKTIGILSCASLFAIIVYSVFAVVKGMDIHVAFDIISFLLLPLELLTEENFFIRSKEKSDSE